VSDDPTPRDAEPELELARPARSGNTPAPTSSGPRFQQVRSAARADAPAPEPKRAMSRERLQEGAVDILLNSVSILGEVIEDFRSSDRFFKYKALVLAAWLALAFGAVGVASYTTGPGNDIAARLITGGDGSSYLVSNESSDDWQDVEITVNGAWRATESRVRASGGTVALNPAVIFDARGNRAPSSLDITDIQVRVVDPEATVVLLKAGVPQ
jgi:hypothetical protein